MLEFRLLGPVEVCDGERSIPLAGRGPRALLVALLLRRGEALTSDRLIDYLWGEQPPPTARNSLHNHISALRKALGHGIIATTADGYAARVDAGQVDVDRFERLVAQAQTADSDEQRALTLHEALALWRGPALANVAYEPFALLEAPRLEQMRLAARQDLLDAELALQRHAEVLPELEELVAANPFDERLRGQLMLCLYRCGRQADALSAYRDARDFLVEELGIEPSPPLRELEQGILRQDVVLAGAVPEHRQALPTRRRVTALVADVANADSLDAEALHRLLDRALTAMRDAVERHGGAVESFAGERLLAVFGLHSSHEDDALRALRAAVELRNQLESDELELRIGIDTGEVFASDAITGAVISIAKRLVEAAAPQEILLGSSTMQLVHKAVEKQAVEPVQLHKNATVEAWRLLGLVQGAAAIPRRLDAPLVGRHDELATLHDQFESVCVERRCRQVALVGEAGMGKTRLARELVGSVRDEATILIGRCVSYGEGATWLPLAEIVRDAGDVDALLAEQPDGELVGRRIAGALGADAEIASVEETSWAVRRLLETLSLTSPVLVVLEDVHWAEPALLNLIDYVGAHASGRILLLSLTRPELLESRPGWVKSAIPLAALAEADLAELVSSLDVQLDTTTRGRVVEVAEGNPLFAEQLVAHAQEQGPGSLDSVPPSIEGLLASRLDFVEPDERRVLQHAAIIGREFSHEALVALSDQEVDGQLRSLARNGFIRAGRSGDSLSFHHVLLRNVSYVQIPKSVRADLHERFANWSEGSDELVGHHLEQASRYLTEVEPAGVHALELAHRAADRLAAAGRRAASRDDWHAAANLLSRAAALLPGSDPERAPLLATVGEAFAALGDFTSATEAFDEAIDSARALDDRKTEWRSVIERSLFQRTTDEEGWFDQARRDAATAIGLFEELGDDRGLASAWRFASWIDQWNGQYGAAVAALERALGHARRARDEREENKILGNIGPNLVFGPEPADVAAERLGRELQVADSEGRLALAAGLRRDVGALHAMAGRFEQARATLAEAGTVLTELDLVSDYGLTAEISGYVEALAGNFDAAERDYRAARAIFEQTGESCRRLTAEVELAHTLVQLGQDDEALELTEIAAREVPADEFYCHALWRTARAKALARRGKVAEAEKLGREALELVEPTDDLSTHAGVLADLAQVVRAAGQGAEAKQLAEKALRLYQRKGNMVLAAQVLAFLDALSTTTVAL